jgi:hypothetical protein
VARAASPTVSASSSSASTLPLTKSQSGVLGRSEIPLDEFELSEELLAHFAQCQRRHEAEYTNAWRAAEARGHPAIAESPEDLTAALLAP